MMRKFLQTLLSRENIGKVLYLEHYMNFYLDMELCQTILLQNLPTHLTPFCLKEYHSCSNNQQVIFNNTLRSAGNTTECWRHGGGFLRKTIDIQIERVPKLIYSCFVLHNFCERNNRCRTDEEGVQAQIHLHRNADKTTPNIPDEVYSHSTTEGGNIREILTKYVLENLSGNYSTYEIKFCMLVVIKYTNNSIIWHFLFYTVTFIFLFIWYVSFLTHT